MIRETKARDKREKKIEREQERKSKPCKAQNAWGGTHCSEDI